MTNKKNEDCIFCNFVTGKFKTPGIFWQDDNFLAFLTIFPNTKGATVIIPKNHYQSDVLALDDNILQDFILASKKVSSILVEKFEDVGRVGLIMEGTGINHAHIKLYPMHGTAFMKRGEWQAIPSTADKRFFKTYEGYLSSHDSEIVSDENIKSLANKLIN